MTPSTPFPRPRSRPDDGYARRGPQQPDGLPKRVPGAALHGVSGARNAARAEQPPLAWRPYPAAAPRGQLKRSDHLSLGDQLSLGDRRSLGDQLSRGDRLRRLVAAVRARLRRR